MDSHHYTTSVIARFDPSNPSEELRDLPSNVSMALANTRYSVLQHGLRWTNWEQLHGDTGLMTKQNVLEAIKPSLLGQDGLKETRVYLLMRFTKVLDREPITPTSRNCVELKDTTTVGQLLSTVPIPATEATHAHILIVPRYYDSTWKVESISITNRAESTLVCAVPKARCYKTEGPLHPSGASSHFLLQPNVAEAAEKLQTNNVLILTGPILSGKTTLLLHVTEYFEKEGFHHVNLKLPPMMSFTSIDAAWTYLGSCLPLSQLPHHVRPSTDIANFTDFLACLQLLKDHLRLLITIDDFDNWLNPYATPVIIKEEVKNNIATLVKWVRKCGPKQKIRMICAGSSAVHTFIGVHSNVRVMSMQKFTLSDTSTLLHLYCDAYGRRINDSLTEDVYESTGGQPALVAGMLAAIASLSEPHELINVTQWNAWQQTGHNCLPHMCARIQKVLSELSPGALSILEAALGVAEVCFTSSTANAATANALAHNGLLEKVVSAEEDDLQDDLAFVRPCVVMRRWIYSHLVLTSLFVCNDPLPMLEGNILDIRQTILKVIEILQAIWQHGDNSRKLSKFPKSFGLEVPNEALYHMEIFFILRCWLSRYGVTVEPEAAMRRFDSSGEADLLLSTLTKMYILEFAASITPQGAEEHYGRTVKYVQDVKAESGACITFTCVALEEIDSLAVDRLGWPAVAKYNSTVLAFHVLHNEDMSTYRVYQLRITEGAAEYILVAPAVLAV